MSPQEPLGPFCQSCSMPLGTPEDFGTDRTGYRVNDYCHYCFRDGAFTNPGAALGQMIELSVDFMAQRGIMPEAKARALLTEVMPGMKRWREGAGQGVLQGASGRGLLAGDEQC